MKEYWSTHDTCIDCIQNASTTCDEPIKKACDPKKGSHLPTYLFTYKCLPTYLNF
jgi:hypothetical protein